jgi:hypothetical protein
VRLIKRLFASRLIALPLQNATSYRDVIPLFSIDSQTETDYYPSPFPPGQAFLCPPLPPVR